GGAAAVSGLARFRGEVGAAAPWPVDLSGDFADFDPGQLVTMPPALLNGNWTVSGRFAGSDGGRLRTKVTLARSMLKHLPLGGDLAANFALQNGEPRRMEDVQAAIRWGSSTIDASGALGAAA